MASMATVLAEWNRVEECYRGTLQRRNGNSPSHQLLTLRDERKRSAPRVRHNTRVAQYTLLELTCPSERN
ncbi:Hypothetical predicted protein [Marmota monax]|uniref:Uncharacterized protein n=1 Tax=Marmota monax TaxID=9995 RepID=A0A5E4CS07_MARMO|nr:hypothetical protein GHT09_015282 [Marmota monax]VTJ84585.1 Hypothetical predicted protein [Marmota monax]